MEGPVKLFSLRLPDEMHETLKALAEREGRSIHAQILYLLRKALEVAQ